MQPNGFYPRYRIKLYSYKQSYPFILEGQTQDGWDQVKAFIYETEAREYAKVLIRQRDAPTDVVWIEGEP